MTDSSGQHGFTARIRLKRLLGECSGTRKGAG